MFLYKLVLDLSIIDYKEVYFMSQQHKKKELGQYFTPKAIGEFMANLFESSKNKKNITLLDPGAGSGNLTVAFVNRILEWKIPPLTIHVDLYEIDFLIIDELSKNLKSRKVS